MNFPHTLFDSETLVITGAISGLCLVEAIRRTPWRKLDPLAINAWMGTCVVLMGLWSLRGTFKPGLDFHLLGSVAFTLLAGPWLALIGMAIVLIGLALAGFNEWQSFGVHFLVLAGLPVMITAWSLHWAQHRLPTHYFVYIFVNAFMTAGAAFFVTGFATVSMLAITGLYPLDELFGDALAFYFLLSWSEAFTTGLMMAVFVVYKPHWVATFDDRRYLYQDGQSR